MRSFVDIGVRLREERDRLALDQSDLASRVGVSRTSQSNYERGERAPDAEYLRKVAELGVDVLYVVTGERLRDIPAAAAEAESESADRADVMERLKKALRASSLDVVAEMLGEKRATVGSWSARRSVPLDGLVKASKIANCSLDYLILGKDGQLIVGEAKRWPPQSNSSAVHLAEKPAPWLTPQSATPQSEGYRANPEIQHTEGAALLRSRGAGAVLPLVLSLPLGEPGGRTKEYQVVPTHMRHASAGKGDKQAAQGDDQLNLAGDLAFGFDWMRRNFKHTSGQLTAIQVRGDSMATTLLDGDTIIIDEGVQDVEVDGIYVFDFYGRRLVKRLQQLSDGSLLLISDNQNYQRETVPRDRARDIRVIGRMVWPRIR